MRSCTTSWSPGAAPAGPGSPSVAASAGLTTTSQVLVEHGRRTRRHLVAVVELGVPAQHGLLDRRRGEAAATLRDGPVDLREHVLEAGELLVAVVLGLATHAARDGLGLLDDL